MAEAANCKNSRFFEAGGFIDSLYLKLILNFFSFLTFMVQLLLQTYIHDAHLSNCGTKGGRSRTTALIYNRHWIIRYVREKTFPRSSESNHESRSVALTRFRRILVVPYDMVYIAYVLVLSASWYWITVWHDITKYLACARVQQAWRDEPPGGTRLMSSKQTNCPYKIMFVLHYYINRSLAFPLPFIKNKAFWKEQATFQTQTLWK